MQLHLFILLSMSLWVELKPPTRDLQLEVFLYLHWALLIALQLESIILL